MKPNAHQLATVPAIATGTLAKTPAAHLFVYAHDRRLTGSFEFVVDDSRRVDVVVHEGKLVKARASFAATHLGRVLFELGAITHEELNDSLRELAETKRLHGQILLDRGSITKTDLEAALRDQALRQVRHVFSLPHATVFAFHHGVDHLPVAAPEKVHIDLLPVVWHGIREFAPWPHVKAALMRVHESRCRAVVRGSLDPFHFDADETAIVKALGRTPMSLDDVIQAGTLRDDRARLLMYFLLVTKQLEILSPPGASRSIPLPSALTSSSSEAAAPSAIPLARPSTPPSQPQMAAVPSSGQYSTAFKVRAANGITIPSPNAASFPPQTNEDTDGHLSPEHRARKREIVARAMTIEDEDYFDRLEVGRSAAPSQIRAAFVLLAQTWHPGRVPVVLADVRDDVATVFTCMDQAHRTLMNPELRAAYEARLHHVDAARDARANADRTRRPSLVANEVADLERCLARMDYQRAEELCRLIVAIEPTHAEAAATSAWLAAIKSDDERFTRMQVAAIDDVIAVSPKCARGYYLRAQLHKRLGEHGSAVRDFRRASMLAPSDPNAIRELRLYELRTKNGSLAPDAKPEAIATVVKSSGISGLFAKLVKK